MLTYLTKFELRRELIYLRDLVYELVVRDMKLRYKRSVLGFAWTLLTPLFLFLVFQFLFQFVLKVEVPRFGPYAFSGLLVYAWFQGAIVQSAADITGSRELVIRPGFPVYILPLVTVTTHFIYFLLAFSAFILFLLLFGEGVELSILFLPFIFPFQFILTLGLCYFVASANVFFRDTQHIVVLAFQLLLFLSPIFYEAKAVPETYQSLYNLNPLVHLLEAYRSLLFRGLFFDWVPLLVIGLGALVLLSFSLHVFLKVRYRFVEEL